MTVTGAGRDPGECPSDERVTRLVVGDHLALLVGHDPWARGDAEAPALDRLVEVLQGHLGPPSGGRPAGWPRSSRGEVGARRSPSSTPATASRSTSAASGLPRRGCRGSRAGRAVGQVDRDVRSKRPGRTRAESSMSGRLVAAITITLALAGSRPARRGSGSASALPPGARRPCPRLRRRWRRSRR